MKKQIGTFVFLALMSWSVFPMGLAFIGIYPGPTDFDPWVELSPLFRLTLFVFSILWFVSLAEAMIWWRLKFPRLELK